MIKANILIVDDDQDVLLAASMLLKGKFSGVKTLQDPAKLMNLVSRESFDAILLDMNYSQDTSSGNEGFFWLRNILVYKPDANVILMTAYGDVERAVRAIKEGAKDYVLKPWQNDKLIETITSVLKNKEVSVNSPSTTYPSYPSFVGQSKAMLQLFEIIKKVAPTDANVLIAGENGTGKELVANELHRLSSRNDHPFVSVDVGSLHESVFESELFGYVKGAFTDAQSDRTGRFELAHGGTLFLDEIGNLSVNQQAKILTAIQHKTITRMGSNKAIALDIRIISATNAPLAKMVEVQHFRQDLLYRLNTVVIQVPPLRHRKEDIRLLFEYYLDVFCKKYQKTFANQSHQHIIEDLEKHNWPGNVRELRHMIESAVIMSDPEMFILQLPGPGIGNASQEGLNLELMEKSAVLSALKKHTGNISKAAAELGLTRAALYRRIEKYEIQQF